jgi:hypothetical protein
MSLPPGALSGGFPVEEGLPGTSGTACNPSTQEADIRRMAAQSQPRQIVREPPSQKTLHKKPEEWPR